jgi:hypothetical protein
VKHIAEDLDAFLANVGPKKVVIEQDEATNKDAAKLARAAVSYTLSQADPKDTPQVVGEAVALGVRAASQDQPVNEATVRRAAISYLESVVEAAREALED